MQENRSLVVLWLTRANYDRAVALSEDVLPASYELWRARIDAVLAGLPAGVDVVRIEADPDEVAAWCRAHGHRLTAQGRSAFAAARAQCELES